MPVSPGFRPADCLERGDKLKCRHPQLDLLYLDNHLLVVNKPAGLLIQGDKTGDPTLLQAAKRYLKEKYDKPGNVYLGLVHRLDRPVSGVVVFARTSKAASRLSEQFRQKKTRKSYSALVKGKLPEKGTLIHQIEKRGRTSRSVTGERGKTAELSFRRVRFRQGISEVEIDLITGRYHQIRVQLASLGFPVIGDRKYGSRDRFPNRTIALHASCLTLFHPVTNQQMRFHAEPPVDWLSINKA